MVAASSQPSRFQYAWLVSDTTVGASLVAASSTSMHAALRLELSYDADPGWQWMCAAVRGAWAQLDEQVCRTALPTTPAELALDRRRRVA